MLQTADGYLDLDGGKLYYESAGSGVPLVLSHAAFLDSRMFDAQWDTLAQRFHVIRYDMRGYGRSSDAGGPICRRADLKRLLDHLKVTQAHLVGCSNGGEIMLDLALTEPHLAATLTLVDSTPSGFQLQGEPPRYMNEMFDAVQREEIDRGSELQIRIWFDGQFREPEQVDQALREKALAMNRILVERKTFLIADTQPVCPLDPPAVARLNEVNCPVLVVAGALDHPEILRAADMMTAGISKARKVIIEGSGHVPSYEQPELFTAQLLSFLPETVS